MSALPVRVLHFSPGTATGRHDSLRAALGLAGFVGEGALELGVEQAVEVVHAYPAMASREAVWRTLEGAGVLVVATPTYAQGSPWYVRRYFELTAGMASWGTPATAMATGGGVHTGAEVALMDTFRSLQGLGMATFTFGQKWVAMGMQQRHGEDGEFGDVDAWFVRALARVTLMHALRRRGLGEEAGWASRLGLETDYYRRFPTEGAMGAMVGQARRLMNAPLRDARGWEALAAWAGQGAMPPDVTGWPAAGMFPRPPGEGW